MLFAAALAVLTACVNDELRESAAADKLAGIDAQLEAVMASAEDIKALNEALGEHGADVNEVSEAVAQHVEFLKGGASLKEAALAAIDLQKEVACVVGTVEGNRLFSDSYDKELKDMFEALHAGVSIWLGESFSVYYPAALANAKVTAVLADLNPQIDHQKLSVDALVSDVQSGLRTDEDPEELLSLSASVNGMSKASETLVAEMSALVQELEAEYKSAINAMFSEQSSFDADALSELNAAARTKAEAATPSLNDLAERVKECKSALEALQGRLGAVEGDLEELLEMIQSVTFISEKSSDYAVAYYDMDMEGESTAEGYKPRIPKNAIDLTYMVRPASAAAVFADSELWNQDIKVLGYYAGRIQQAAVPSIMNFEIEDVVVSPETGMVTLTVKNNLSEDFFYKRTGAKMALSVTNGKTDISSKFVEIVPQDASGKVYLESIKLSEQKVEFAVGETFRVNVALYPENVTDKYVAWNSANGDIMAVEDKSLTENKLTAIKVGSTTLTVTTSGTDEWGRPLTASCPVKVNPAIRLLGPAYVEQGKTAELTLDFPPAMVIDSKVWYVDDAHTANAKVENGVVTGLKDTYSQYTYDYSTITVTCIVNGDVTLSHDMKVVVPQPRQIKFNNYADNVTSVDMKVDESISFAATILPDNVKASQFRLFYESDGGLGWIESSTGLVKAPQTPGPRYVYANVFNVDKHHYFAPGVSLRRTVVVNVHPYYVNTMTFAQSTMTLAPDQTASLAPVFTSDVDGKQPTYKDLKWESSDPSVVSVNATTGEIKTLKEGTATITATTTHDYAVPSGQAQKSASVKIIVAPPVDPVYVGDYFYSDGTWSTQRNYGKTVIGIVISNSPITSDSELAEDYPKATHGVVLGLTEYNSTLGQFGYSNVYSWLEQNGYPVHDETAINGYGLTKGMTAYRSANSSYVELYDTVNGPVAKHKVAVPSGASSWYIPSYKEMKLIHENKSVINAALANAGGTKVEGSLYWLSTLRTYNSYNDCQGSPFDMVNGGWYAYDKKTTSYPVRVVFAF